MRKSLCMHHSNRWGQRCGEEKVLHCLQELAMTRFDEGCISKALALCFRADGFKKTKSLKGRADEKTAVHALLESMVAELWCGYGPTLAAIVRAGHDKIQMKDAALQLVGKPPKDAAALVRLAASGQKTACNLR